ncbi:UDP-glucosyltransferase 2-like [Schistocerca nitens]|uniref:UDP-glucosyltransferase 2-like n=1 Tax=Schistocerca nitens TaxID=7011 RepID=UPI002118B538|nr:UDP-glucosyltransferase 2-like [Schistocerca nitens]XP_049803193.1 UDP-glucosyltransferase 2-like [Schistocerca nitens]XP_049803194.1 UDP-glucosyltransferase 2-like [Schistocerca nitens]
MLQVVTFSLLAVVSTSSAAKILVIAPSPSYSHQEPFHILTKALLQRGHRVTLMTTDSMKISHENYTEIDLSIAYRYVRGHYDFLKVYEETPTRSMAMRLDISANCAEMQLNETSVQRFIRSGETYDLAILEGFIYMCYYGLIHKMGSPPVVKLLTMTAPSSVYYNFGSPKNPAYMPDMWLGYSDRMNFWQRLYNTYFYLRLMHMWFCQAMPVQEALMRKHFGPDPPSVYEADRNVSLLITTNHFVMEYPRPHLPNIIEITGIHVATEQKPLPKTMANRVWEHKETDIKQFLDGAEHGVIYFSLGTNVRSNAMSDWKRQAFIEAFRELPQRVLWKWENDSLPGRPENVMVSKWLPQQGVLAHPNVRLFITQGGLQSLNEATYHDVPLLVIPFFCDQAHNAAKIQQSGAGVRLEYRDITKDDLLRNIRTVLHDSKYRESMRTLSSIFREHQVDSLDRAVWWLEYVIRHKGAPHLRSAALDLHWWQRLLLDVVAFLLLVAAIAIYLLCISVRRLVQFLSGFKVRVKTE